MAALTVPEPDVRAAFLARLRRLLDALTAQLADDRERLLVLPQSADAASHARWTQQMAAERRGRTHLSTWWQMLTLNPAFRAPPLPWTIGTALQLVEAGLDDVAKELESEVRFCVERFVDRKLRNAVLARPDVVDQWPRPRMDSGVAACALHALTAILTIKALPKDEHPPHQQLLGHNEDGSPIYWFYWPGNAAPLLIVRWARKGLEALGGFSDALLQEASRGIPSDVFLPNDGKSRRISIAGLAVLYLAESDVREDSRRPAIAIDASKVHHQLVGGMRDWPQDGRRHRGAPMDNVPAHTEDAITRVELLAPGSTVQLHLPLPELEGLQDHAIQALRRLRGTKGLRHWAALLRLFSVEGGRSGTYRWLLDEHLTAMGYDERRRRDPKVRDEAAAEIEALASLELAIYTQGGVLRERRRLLLETGRFERLVGSQYKLDGIEFQMNQRVYGGVRASTGEIGHKWMPAPIELARIDHVRFPYAHALGMLLAIRFRWRLDESADFLAIKGEKLIELAGIPLQKAHPERIWKKLGHTLDVLQEIGQISRYEWDDAPWSMAGICRIWSSPWILDRVVRGVLPEETPPDRDKPVTGAELKTWREKRGWSQRETAKQLKVTAMAISKAEAKPNEPLGHKLRAAFESRRNTEPQPQKSISV
jgi:hypothetical protein